MASARSSLAVSIFTMVIAGCISAETCERVDTCSCKFKNGSIVNLKPADGGDLPKYTGIKGDQGRTFDWNPCTPFDHEECKQVLSCQIANEAQYPAGTKYTTFSVDSEGNVVITYGKSKSGSSERQTKITLKCDHTTNGTTPERFTEDKVGSLSTYSGMFKSKYCCATRGSSSGGLSAGSIILIIFFPLLLMYFIIGMLVNRYGRGIESMPELIPNYSFWADIPFLVKDGVVFTYDRIKTTCAGKCGKSGYAEI